MPATLSTPSSLSCPPRWGTRRRPERRTIGPRIAATAQLLGTPLMPWQRYVAEVAGEIHPDTGRLAYREVRLTIPRQEGKTTLGLSVIVDRCLNFGSPQRASSTAQSGKDARAKFVDDFLPVLNRSRLAPMFRARLTNGSEAIRWNNGSHWAITPPTETAGHGSTIDFGFIDEAFAMVDDRVEQAYKPAMVTRPEPQLWIVSTAGIPDRSPYLWQKVETGRAIVEADIDDGVAYFEWSAPDDADPEDPATWAACMPALGHTITESAIRANLLSMGLSEFRRAFLNQWVRTAHDQVIDPEAWDKCSDRRARPVDPVSFAFDVSPDQSTASIVACGGDVKSGLPVVDVVDTRGGTEWVVDRLLDLRDRWSPRLIVADFGGPAGALRGAVESAGLDVRRVTMQEHSAACGGLYAAAIQGQFRHRDQPALNAALGGASKRPLGDAWAWSRKASSVDITPLVASTLALWAHEQHVETVKKKQLFAF